MIGGVFGRMFLFLEGRPFLWLGIHSYVRVLRFNRYVSVGYAPRPEAMAGLIERLSYDGRVRHVKDKTYFSWRFYNPLRCYRFLFWEDNRLEGYLVLQKNMSGFADRRILRIVDWEASSRTVFADLLQAALKIGKFSEIEAWTATLPSEMRSLLEREGFKTYEQGALGPSVLVRSVQNAKSINDFTIGGRRLIDMKDWDLRMIYSMHG